MPPNMVSKSSALSVLCVAVLLNLCHRASAELYSAISEVEPLLETHKRIIDDLDIYIQKEESRLKILKKYLDQYSNEHEKAMEDIPNYLGNPINAFTLIKRLTTDLYFIENSIKMGSDNINNITMNHVDFKYPTLEDLTGAAQALTRLQETYKLNVHYLSEGILNGVIYGTPMTTDECFELGKALYNEKDFTNALAWMTEALRKYQLANDEICPFTDVDIMEYIAYAHYLLGDIKTALEWTNKLLAIDPQHVRALVNAPYFTKNIKEQEKLSRESLRDIGDSKQDIKEKKTPIDDGKANDRKSYEMLCRGEIEISSEVSKRLKCWYSSDNHPFLKYAPIKTEQVYIKPDIFIFHEVISDDEIEFVKSVAKPRFTRALVYHHHNTSQQITSSTRISKVAWIKDEESSRIARISRRITDMTGLSMIYAEPLQVLNYGIGGHYEPHYDCDTKDKNHFTNNKGGNRIATVLFYMSDVAQGGATVFTELGLRWFPVKRAAAFWLNLHPSGEEDMATRHAACPVLRGSKWVSNKWIHQSGQEFIRPCGLEYEQEGILPSLHRAVPKTCR